ncbi:putative RNA-directed DNA polymerase [Rosa chinensis]|uniref:Putative RNA-directed DNA polymerase n=1 Tax=Rosa chinensis TaxID=74649 RepID=A0A2P6QIL9_ROSCH|nr:putative RNA-directed DNA polymerase [Rosa chinensis]
MLHVPRLPLYVVRFSSMLKNQYRNYHHLISIWYQSRNPHRTCIYFGLSRLSCFSILLIKMTEGEGSLSAKTESSDGNLNQPEEDKVFQLLASLGYEYEDLRSHLLMSPEFPSFTTVCNSIQREEVSKKVMNMDSRVGGSEAMAFAANKSVTSDRTYKGKRPYLKCTHCEHIGRTGIGHTRERCWILHPELKPKFNEDQKNQRGTIQRSSYISNLKANFSNTSEEMMKFTSNPITIINEFATYLQKKQGSLESNENGSTTAMLGNFAGFLSKSNMASLEDILGIICAISIALDVSKNHDFWIVDSGASDHMTNNSFILYDFETVSKPSHVSIANGNDVPILGKGKLKLFLDSVESFALFVPSFPFQLLSVGRLMNSLDCLTIFSPSNVVFQDRVSKKKIGEGSQQPVQQIVDTEEVQADSNTQDHQPEVVPNMPQPRRNPPRGRHLPARLQEYETYTPRYPLAQVAHSTNSSSPHRAFLIKISKEGEPRNFEEANQSLVWKEAMHDELKALDDNRTWSIVKLPKRQKIVGARWIYKIKFNSDDSIERHKARLVARGFTQTFGVDYKETFAPVAKMNTVRVLLSVAVNCGWSLYQMDVKNAFLHGDLEEDVYMRLPPGHSRESESGMVCKLHKALYGLKQSPRAWYSKLSSVLLASSFKRSHADSMFIRNGKASKLVVLVILRYLKGTVDRGIVMKNNGHFNLVGYSDSDWAGNAIDRKSTTGYCTFIGGNLVTWKSKKQTVVAHSSAEAEYRAMASITCELIWLKTLLGDLGIVCTMPISLHCDNQAAMHIAANPVFHERTKHIEVNCHFVRDQVQSKLIKTVYTRSCDQLAVIFTKILTFAQFERLLSKLGSRNCLDPA